MLLSLSVSSAASAFPSVWRAAVSAAIASSRLASAPAHAAFTAASSSSTSADSRTPRKASSPSIVGAASPALTAAARAATAIDSSAARSIRTAAVAPSRCEDRVAKQVPRASALASRVRASPSARSKGAAMRKRMSRPLALTVLSSNVQRHVPPLPAARANPVIDETAPCPGFSVLARPAITYCS